MNTVIEIDKYKKECLNDVLKRGKKDQTYRNMQTTLKNIQKYEDECLRMRKTIDEFSEKEIIECIVFMKIGTKENLYGTMSRITAFVNYMVQKYGKETPKWMADFKIENYQQYIVENKAVLMTREEVLDKVKTLPTNYDKAICMVLFESYPFAILSASVTGIENFLNQLKIEDIDETEGFVQIPSNLGLGVQQIKYSPELISMLLKSNEDTEWEIGSKKILKLPKSNRIFKTNIDINYRFNGKLKEYFGIVTPTKIIYSGLFWEYCRTTPEKERNQSTYVKFCSNVFNKATQELQSQYKFWLNYEESINQNIKKIPYEKEERSFVKMREVKQNSIDEEMFIEKTKELCASEGIDLSLVEVANIHTCVKTNLLTILSGSTGVGKTSVARLYANAIGATDESETMLFLPISPSHKEPCDVMGYYNSMNGVYVASETGLVDFLIRAMHKQDKMHVIIFDEMNLSQIEHWFAPFLSVLELKQEQRKLRLYSSKTRCLNDDKYPPEITIGANVRMIGTINMDETVKEISDRVLDRVNLVRISKKELSLVEKKTRIQKGIEVSLDKYLEWFNPSVKMSKDELGLFDAIDIELLDIDDRKGISNRTINKIANYLSNWPLTTGRGVALDYQLNQRVLSKVRGHRLLVEPLVGKYNSEDNSVQESAILSILESENYKHVSSFEESSQMLMLKAKEVFRYGYCY